MQIGDANGGMKECLGMIKNATIYLTESELPTVTDLWVHKGATSYKMLLGRRWATINWAAIEEKPEGTYLKFTSEGDDYSVNAAPNPSFRVLGEGPRCEWEAEEENIATIHKPRQQGVFVVKAAWNQNGKRGQKPRNWFQRSTTYEKRRWEDSGGSEADEWEENGKLRKEVMSSGDEQIEEETYSEMDWNSFSEEEDKDDQGERWVMKWEAGTNKHKSRPAKKTRWVKEKLRRGRQEGRKGKREMSRSKSESSEDEEGEEGDVSDEPGFKGMDTEEFIRLVVEGG